MRIHVTNTVCCNGGDAAILMGVETLLKKRFGDELVLSIADSAPEIVASFYPHLETMPLAFDRISVRYKGSWKRPFRPLAIGRFWTGAYLLAHKWEGLANHLLTHEERAGLQVLKNADAVLSTGGTYLTQNYSLRSRLWEFRLAKLFGKPLMLMSQTIGPFDASRQRKRLARDLRSADLIMVRDQRSMQLLEKMQLDKARCVQVPDAAFALKKESKTTIASNRSDVSGQPPRAAISVRSWKHFQSQTRSRGMQNYQQAIVETVTEMVRSRGFHVTFVSTCQGIVHYWTDDSRLATEIVEHLPEDVRAHVDVVTDFHKPAELIEFLRAFDVVISTRMHFAILALVANIPVLPISYEFKTDELFQQLGQSHLVTNIENICASKLLSALEMLMQRSEAEQEQIHQSVNALCREAAHAGDLVGDLLAKTLKQPLAVTDKSSDDSGTVKIGQTPRVTSSTPRSPEDKASQSLWMICPSIGASSETWMYRQASGLAPGHLKVKCWSYPDPETFPQEGFTADVIPSASGSPLKRSKSLLPIRFGSKYRFTTDTARYLHQQLSADRPQAIVCQYGHLAIATLQVSKRLGIPTFVHFHGNDITARLRKRQYRNELLEALPSFAGIVCVAGYQRDWLVEQGIDENSIRVIPCGVPTDEFAMTHRIGQSKCRFLAVGRLVEKKAPHLTIRAFAQLAKLDSDSELRFVGDGKLRKRCEALVNQFNLNDRVRFLGSLPPGEVAAEMKAADVFVQHSVTTGRGDKEGWPVSIAEAAASGLPIISTRHAGIVDQVIEGKSGLLSEEHDWRQMGRHMIRLASSPSLRLKLGFEARRHIEGFDTSHQLALLRSFVCSAGAVEKAKAA